MSQRRENYRAALRREQDDVSGPRSTKVTSLQSRYIRVTVEVDPDLQGDLTRWVGRPVSSVVFAGTSVLRSLAATVGRVTRPGG
ncbi:hypothetical protein ACFXN2_00120 [Streptomyces kronopolitis]|uniref:Uncharacterized protein n=1 Tax=Streptomyces kronopolitis TaxID=1612435 RepID=A0ABQ2IXD6_9ACTN|nr:MULTISPECIES: hypothetical protein [Streptomyces]MCL6302804.1 hypothetical protein [Streptomyces kronopolitis]GGN33930.1 hypothetical protein GCM10012285_05580 [Streptomyces kronopolitis]GLW15637.1 hypothetical protein Stsp01_23800 [Streptomyces sp. NBRC 13847]